MDLSMKGRNDRAAREAYEKEGQELIKEACRKREEISRKHEDDPRPRYPGLDGRAEDKESREVTLWFDRELKKLKKKHGIK
ncbi:MAG: hypothetical protein NC331_16660 [Lachnospiraceae bacterium]|nr:hypothetical protein [Lachnospiraceae bacterium]MCM1240983.1 hypothetical protein [Lachnospiraceae bacterium]